MNNTDYHLNTENIHVIFTANDMNDQEKYIYEKGEEFKVNYKIINKSGQELNYYSGLPIVSFTILQNDSIICSSTDHMVYEAIMIDGTVEDGKSFSYQWIGPNTMGRKDVNELIELTPGSYQITVKHKSFFKEYKLPNTELITIEIIN